MMSKNYRAKVRIDLSGSSRRQYRSILDVVSSTLLKHEETAGALVFGSENDRRIDFIVQVGAASSSGALSKFDTFARRVIYAIDPHSSVRTLKSPAVKHPAAISREQVTTELLPA